VDQQVQELMPYMVKEQSGVTEEIDKTSGFRMIQAFYKIEQTDKMVEKFGGLS